MDNLVTIADRENSSRPLNAPGPNSLAAIQEASSVERILGEGALGMSAVARRLGKFRDGRATHPSTPTRWVRDGIELPDGRRLHLEAVVVSGRLVTSWQAVLRFIAAQQPPNQANNPSVFVRSPTQRRQASDAAAEAMRQLGA
jgi:hypothetical protein